MKYSIDFTNKFKKSLRKGVKRGLDPVLDHSAQTVPPVSLK